MTSASSAQDVEMRAQRLGVRYVLSKPLDLVQLLRLVGDAPARDSREE